MRYTGEMKQIPALVAFLPKDVTLIAVSKQQPDEKIQTALDQGLRVFGENRVQEAYTHWAHRRTEYPDLTLHLIGPLQSNKVAEAVALFDVIHTVDREKIARALANGMRQQNRRLPCFIQVNTGDEPQKAGVSFAALPAFYELCTKELGLDVIGLMCIPPVGDEPAPHFRTLKAHGDALGLKKFSMGMSGDYSEALTCGATHIRLGSAIFGDR